MTKITFDPKKDYVLIVAPDYEFIPLTTFMNPRNIDGYWIRSGGQANYEDGPSEGQPGRWVQLVNRIPQEDAKAKPRVLDHVQTMIFAIPDLEKLSQFEVLAQAHRVQKALRDKSHKALNDVINKIKGRREFFKKCLDETRLAQGMNVAQTVTKQPLHIVDDSFLWDRERAAVFSGAEAENIHAYLESLRILKTKLVELPVAGSEVAIRRSPDGEGLRFVIKTSATPDQFEAFLAQLVQRNPILHGAKIDIEDQSKRVTPSQKPPERPMAISTDDLRASGIQPGIPKVGGLHSKLQQFMQRRGPSSLQ